MRLMRRTVTKSGTVAITGVEHGFASHPSWQAAALQEICVSHGVPLAAAALQYPLSHPAVTGIVSGGKAATEFAENQALFARVLSNELWSEMEAFVASLTKSATVARAEETLAQVRSHPH